jgi:hypothetical protein
MFGKQRIDQVLEAYLLALAGRDQCPDSASPLLKHSLAENLDRAEKAYAYAVADGLEGGGLEARSLPLDMAVADLTAANARAREGLQKTIPLSAVLVDLETSTRLALAVLTAAGIR